MEKRVTGIAIYLFRLSVISDNDAGDDEVSVTVLKEKKTSINRSIDEVIRG